MNRAYTNEGAALGLLLRLESVAYVLVAAVAILAFVPVVLAPFIWGKLVTFVPTLEPLGNLVTFARYAVAVVVLVISLLIVHAWLPAGRRSFTEIAPGIAATLLLWLIAGSAFGRYLATYAFAYVSMYAGLASAMIALVFLYVCASIFIYGGELNSVIAKTREKATRTASPQRLQTSDASCDVLDVFRPRRGAPTSTDMLPGGCWFFHIFICALKGSCPTRTPPPHARVDATLARSGYACEACLRCDRASPGCAFAASRRSVRRRLC